MFVTVFELESFLRSTVGYQDDCQSKFNVLGPRDKTIVMKLPVEEIKW